jgi:DNA-binding NtrC family response regulator
MLEDFDEIRSRLRERPLWRTAHLALENRELREALSSPRADLTFVGTSPAARRVLQVIRAYGAMSGPLLVTGEAGVGKRLVAELVHRASPHAGRPFVSVTCAALPGDLLEAEIFGEPPAKPITNGRLGRVDLARGGTLFLDEIASLPLALQPRLLGLLKALDGNPAGHAGATRIVASTSRDLRELAHERLFNRELAARLGAMSMRVPPLRERQADIIPIAAYLLERVAPRAWQELGPDEEARKALLRYRWPGNVRELERVLQRAVQRSGGRPIGLPDLPPDIAAAATERVGASPSLTGTPLREVERLALHETLQACHGNGAEAARRLGISKKGMYIKMKRFGLARADRA